MTLAPFARRRPFARAALALALFVTSTLAVPSPRAAAQAAFPSDSVIRAILKERVDAGRSAGIVVGTLDAGGKRRVVAYGAGGPTGSTGVTPLDGNSVLEIGSVTKVFTGTLLASMVARGDVRLDDPVAKYLPATVKVPERGGKQITLLDLATQSSGLPRLPSNLRPKDATNPYADYSEAQMYEFLSGYTLPRDIGSRYEYSNLGMGLLGHALARRAGKSYEALVTERILQPLGMSDTRVTLTPAMRARLTPGHDMAGKPVANWDLPTLAGAGALRSTVNDMLTFLAANVATGAGPLSMVMPQARLSRHPTDNPNLSIGLAWHLLKGPGREIVWHNGGTGGYHSFIAFDPAARTGVVVLSNSSSDIDDIGLHLIEPGIPLQALPKTRAEVAVDAATLDAYVGEYELAPTFRIAITRDGASLFAQATDQPKSQLFAESPTSFFLKVVDAQVSFDKDASGKVTQLVLHQNGQHSPGRKVK
ncbi:MAG: serine hydrolase [Gemmatimonadaceae bacterium]